jgi:lysophospholipase L1-like esterase
MNKHLRHSCLIALSASTLAMAQTNTLVAPASVQATQPLASPTPPLVPRTPLTAVTPTDKPRNPRRHAEFLYRITQGNIGLLFLGDSITDGWPRHGEWSWLKFAPYQPADFGVSGERTEDVLWRIMNGELDGIDPKVVILMIGTNNLGQCRDEKSEWTAAGIEKIVETIHQKLPHTKVLLLGVFPRGAKNDPFRAKIAEMNKTISKLDDGKSTRFLDIGNAFLDANGNIPIDVMPDGLHPNAHGYDLWYAAMNPLLTEMLK